MLPLITRPPVLDSVVAQASLERFCAEGMDPYVAEALVRRGVSDLNEARYAYRLLPYKDLKGIAAMAEQLAEAIASSERLTVVADYDCDGATACAVAVSGLRALGATIDFVVPNRFVHGYGLTPSVVDLVRERFPETRWIVTVDNGIASVAGVDAANRLGIGVLVTDHHLPGDVLPNAAGIVNPNQPGCTFPSKNLAGCGVMYYVLAATRDAQRRRGELQGNGPNMAQWLDVVALGTVADVVRLDANNRWLVHQGLEQIRAGGMRPGIRALFEVANADPAQATSQNFGFGLGPRINAAGRLDDMTVGIRCLLSETMEEARRYAQQLNVLNQERKDIERTMRENAWQTIDLEGQDGRFTRVVFDASFHEGVIGIVAGRIKEEANTPVLVFAPGQEEGYLKGSGRSIPGLHLRDALDLVHKRGQELFAKFGGHAMAAGVTLAADRLPRFVELFEAVVSELMDHRLVRKELLVDGVLPTAALDEIHVLAMARQVWGQGFEEPLWRGDFNLVQSSLVGKDGQQKHLKMVVERDGQQWEALHFFKDDLPPSDQTRICLAYRPSVKEFRGERSVTLIVAERGHPAEASAFDLDAALPATERTRGVNRL